MTTESTEPHKTEAEGSPAQSQWTPPSTAGGVIHAIDWKSVAPWTLIFRTFPLAAGFSVVLLGALGVLLSWLLWVVGGWLFGMNESVLQANPVLQSLVSMNRTPDAAALGGPGIGGVILYFWRPATLLFSLPNEYGLRTFAYLAWGLLGSVAVWSWLGGAIARIALLRLGRDETVGLKEALRFSTKRFGVLLAPPFYPLGILLPLALVGSLIGLLMRLDFGVALVGLLWGVGLLITLVASILIIGVWVGWPLMVVTVSAEGSDSLDGLSRGFAYSFQRPLHYVFYLLVSFAFSALCWWLATLLAGVVVDLAYWSVSWGAGSARVNDVRSVSFIPELLGWGETAGAIPSVTPEETGATETADGEASGPSGLLRFGSGALAFWDGAVRMVLNGFLFSLFWCLYAAIYLLLRQQVDETEWDELYLDDASWEPLPDLDDQAETATAPPAASSGDGEPSEVAAAESPDDSKPTEPAPEPPSGETPSGDSTAASEPDDPVEDDSPEKP